MGELAPQADERLSKVTAGVTASRSTHAAGQHSSQKEMVKNTKTEQQDTCRTHTHTHATLLRTRKNKRHPRHVARSSHTFTMWRVERHRREEGDSDNKRSVDGRHLQLCQRGNASRIIALTSAPLLTRYWEASYSKNTHPPPPGGLCGFYQQTPRAHHRLYHAQPHLHRPSAQPAGPTGSTPRTRPRPPQSTHPHYSRHAQTPPRPLPTHRTRGTCGSRSSTAAGEREGER
jgi:hypothetical protein